MLTQTRTISNLHSNTTAANNFPGFSFFVYLAETSPFSKFLVVINLISKTEQQHNNAMFKQVLTTLNGSDEFVLVYVCTVFRQVM